MRHRRHRTGLGSLLLLGLVALGFIAEQHPGAVSSIVGLAVLLAAGWVAWKVARWVHRLGRWNRLRSCGMAEIDRMTGPQFEQRLCVLFRDLGYSVKHLGRSGDFGADLHVWGNGRLGPLNLLGQGKRYGGRVGPDAVREVHAARAHYGVAGAAVITNSHLTAEAVRLAQDCGVQNWDRTWLESRLLDAQRSRMRAA